jgi:hypothetical protein
LSPTARQVLIEGFKASKPYRVISRELLAIGEPVHERTIARRAAEWRTSERRRVAVRMLDRAVLAGCLFRPDELVGLLDRIDLGRGWPERSHRRALRLLAQFCKVPSDKSMKRMMEELILFRLCHEVSNLPTRPAQEPC